jgi:polysaccharide export outer membrane protein
MKRCKKTGGDPPTLSLAYGWFLLFIFFMAGPHAIAASSEQDAAEVELLDVYRLGHGDRLSVQVYGESELSKEYAIGSNGRLSFPFIGEVPVMGLTAIEVGQRLTDALRGDYLIDPKVTVTVVRYRPIYVNGEVKSPGAMDFEPGLTVRQAISLAGGMTDRASARKIYRVPAGGPRNSGKPQKVGLDVRLSPGDTITIEESFF